MWNDDDIDRRARRAISSDYYVPRDKVEIRIDQGWLTLIGDLNWLYEKHAAEADVRLLPGVFGVTNAIAIKQGSEASELRALGMASPPTSSVGGQTIRDGARRPAGYFGG